jgi:excinuclease ABC subunit C
VPPSWTLAYNGIVLTERVEFVPENDREILDAIPARPAVFLLRGQNTGQNPQAEPYVSKTANLRRRLYRLLGPAEERTKRLNLREWVRSIEFRRTGSDFESGFVLYTVFRQIFPKTYQARFRFRFAPFVKLHLENEYPRASVTTRLGRTNGKSLYYGPFASRATAEKFMNDSLDFFKMRRCVDDLHPDPAFPGCVYSEMKMCLAPCFKGCTGDDYSAEVSRVKTYFDTGGDSLVRELARQREDASAVLAFESAALMHAQLEKLKPVVSPLPEIVQRLDLLSALMIQPCHISGAVTFFLVSAGQILAPVAFHIQAVEYAKSQSMESRVHEALSSIPPAKTRLALETMEHLALLKRWYYRTSRIGEIFFADGNGELPMRRIVRGISRVYRGERPETETSANL